MYSTAQWEYKEINATGPSLTSPVVAVGSNISTWKPLGLWQLVPGGYTVLGRQPVTGALMCMQLDDASWQRPPG